MKECGLGESENENENENEVTSKSDSNLRFDLTILILTPKGYQLWKEEGNCWGRLERKIKEETTNKQDPGEPLAQDGVRTKTLSP